MPCREAEEIGGGRSLDPGSESGGVTDPGASTPREEPTVRLDQVSKHFGDLIAVRDLELDIGRGEFFTMLGPSGCGKTTTLRMVAGFEAPTAGTITLDNADITYKAPNQRNVGMVFQSYALFPNMTVAQNIGFGLRVRGEKEAMIKD